MYYPPPYGQWDGTTTGKPPDPQDPKKNPYKENGELKIMSLKFYFECRRIKWYSNIPANMKKAYRDKGLVL